MTCALVPLAEGCEEMEAVIIIDTLRRAQWEVVSAGLRDGPVTASRHVRLLPDTVWASVDASRFDVLVLPGGSGGVQQLMQDERVLQAIRDFDAQGKLVAAVCAGPLVLQKAGIMKGKAATCHPGAAAELTQARRVDERVVRDGHILTSQGPGTSIDFALALVACVDGEPKAREIRRAMVA